MSRPYVSASTRRRTLSRSAGRQPQTESSCSSCGPPTGAGLEELFLSLTEDDAREEVTA
jgi:hypothetical protein